MKYIVLWVPINGYDSRIGSVELNEYNESLIIDKFAGQLMQVDASGTKHYRCMRAPTEKEIQGHEFTTGVNQHKENQSGKRKASYHRRRSPI